MLRVLADYHNPILFDSLDRLFETRLGGELYRPCGMDWHDEGFWKVWHWREDQRDLARQYLDPTLQSVPDGVQSVVHDSGYYPWHVRWEETAPGYYREWQMGRPWRALTLAAAKDTQFDILLCSMPQHIEPFRRLQQEFQPQAKLVFQAGNNWSWITPGWFPDVPNILTSARGITIPPGANSVFYHQEFDTQLFRHHPGQQPRPTVTNLQHCMPEPELFQQMAAQLRDWSWRCLGGGNPGGRGAVPMLHGLTEAAMWLQNTDFLWHVKSADEGYGHNIHMAFACGKPLIVRGSYVQGCTCMDLYEHGQTVIDLDQVTHAGALGMLQDAAANWPTWSQRVLNRFTAVVNFDEEFLQIQKFLERLQ